MKSEEYYSKLIDSIEKDRTFLHNQISALGDIILELFPDMDGTYYGYGACGAASFIIMDIKNKRKIGEGTLSLKNTSKNTNKEGTNMPSKSKWDYWYVITESFDERYPQYSRLSWHHPSKVNPNFTVHNSNTGETKCLFRMKYLCKTLKFEGTKIPEDIYTHLKHVWRENGYPERSEQ